MADIVTESPPLYSPVAADIPRVTELLSTLGEGRQPLLGETLAHVFRSGGKRVRPALVLLSGKLGTYPVEQLITLAASLEVVHAATLVHDDTVDEALTRRGLDTVNALWDGKVAILVGDFLFAQSAELAARLDSVLIMKLLSETVMAMSSGELRQYAASRSRSLDESDYLRRIQGKTASLFAMCCEGAAIVSDQSEREIAALREYGLNLGMAFQIADDVLDFTGDEHELGKPAGSDLRQGTITLPAILLARDAGANGSLKRRLLDGDGVEELIAIIRNSEAPTQALARADEYAEKARAALQIFPSSDARESLRNMTDYVIARRR